MSAKEYLKTLKAEYISLANKNINGRLFTHPETTRYMDLRNALARIGDPIVKTK